MTPSLTLIPTPLGEDAKSKVAYLLETNGNCSLPCWWGITPGQTTWSEAESYLAAFALEISHPSSPQPKNFTYYPSEFPDPNSNSPDDYLTAGFEVNSSGVIEIIDSIAKTSLASMLANNGVPLQIWIEITTNFGPGPMSYVLALFYEKGIMVIYQGTINSGDINSINICPKDIPQANSQLLVWNNTTIRTFQDIGKFAMLLDPNHLRFRLIQEVSDMQPQSFYNYFVNPSATQCIKMPLTDWIK